MLDDQVTKGTILLLPVCNLVVLANLRAIQFNRLSIRWPCGYWHRRRSRTGRRCSGGRWHLPHQGVGEVGRKGTLCFVALRPSFLPSLPFSAALLVRQFCIVHSLYLV